LITGALLLPALDLYLHALPRDPFAKSGSFRYKLTKTGYTLYSIGPDGKDDGGASSADGIPGSKTGRIVITDRSTGDIVAGVNIR
jgi:hypothetical protein